MIQLGNINTLAALRQTNHGYYLTDETGDEVLLPNAYVPESLEKGDEIEVFVYKDSEDRPVATTLKPTIFINEFAVLTAVNVERVGAFMDWGLPKDLLVPHSEQRTKIIAGQSYVVYMYLDTQSQRLVGTTKLNKFISHGDMDLKIGEEVDLLVADKTDLGYKVIINKKYLGLLYKNEVFEVLHIGEQRAGYIKNIRDDNKIDVSLQKQGIKNIEHSAQRILTKLKDTNGFLELTDNSKPEDIMSELRMSKKSFKKGVGFLYMHRMIKLEKKGIRLV
ncbi:S1 RNA-binding domain-containing protein [Bacteroidota bacterium]